MNKTKAYWIKNYKQGFVNRFLLQITLYMNKKL